MKLLRRCDHVLQAAHFANALRAAGIACEVRNTTLSGAIGDIPWLECAPQVWIRDPRDETRAVGCALACGEELERTGRPQASFCRQCGSEKRIGGVR